MKLTISLGQMDVKLGEPEVNLATVQRLSAEAARRGSDIVVFPELWSTGYDLENAERYATDTESGIFAAVSETAKAEGVAVLGSCLSAMAKGGVGNTAVYFDKTGQSLGSYSKLHRFQLMDEHLYLAEGDAPTLVETAWGMAGMSICYDLRFPELYRLYALAGAKMVFVPAEWPYPRLAHWRTLLRARAIENQMFVIACNRVGESKGTSFFGHSCVIDPWGETVIEAGDTETLLTVTIDTELVTAVREKIPVFADRRPEMYRA